MQNITPRTDLALVPTTGHILRNDSRVAARSGLGGLHHEYRLGQSEPLLALGLARLLLDSALLPKWPVPPKEFCRLASHRETTFRSTERCTLRALPRHGKLGN